jgi:ring-1,2-phenylacetyl-CoA epoxidase subunit PaaC
LILEFKLRNVLSQYLLALGDDELILGHRNSEWCGHAPLLEEDIAFANLALDEIGHATIWFTLLADLLEEDRDSYPDRIVFHRNVQDFRNARLLELPNGDWGFSLIRQYLFDLYEMVNLSELKSSIYQPLADAANKIFREEIYHHRHTSAWVQRLGLGTEESHRRMQSALEQAWLPAHQFFSYPGDINDLVYSNIVPSGEHLHETWIERATQFFVACQLVIPEGKSEDSASRTEHTPFLKILVDEMQSVARLDPEAIW